MADTSYPSRVYRDQSGNLKVPSGVEIDVESGGALKIGGTAVDSTAAELNILDGVTATADELNIVDNAPATVTTSAAAGGANVCEVTFTVQDASGSTISSVHKLEIYLSDDSGGDGLTGTSASGTVQAKSGSGTDLDEMVAKKALTVLTTASGTYVLEITDTSNTAFYPCVVNPSTGAVIVGTQLASGDYGA